jgi:hypothetical protein
MIKSNVALVLKRKKEGTTTFKNIEKKVPIRPKANLFFMRYCHAVVTLSWQGKLAHILTLSNNLCRSYEVSSERGVHVRLI